MKDHEIAALVNELTKTAQKFAGTQQLRARIASVVVDPLKALRKPKYLAPVTDCEACLTPDACGIRGQCAHYLREVA